MYKTVTPETYKKELGLSSEYSIAGIIIYGSYKKHTFQLLKDALTNLNIAAEFKTIPHEFMENVLEFNSNGLKYWFILGYGGALLSEQLHINCLLGSKKNILLGSCGGLKSGAKGRELVIPPWSYAEESSAKAYRLNDHNKYYADEDLSQRLIVALSKHYAIHEDPTITHQAMLAENYDNVLVWSDHGYAGVEMEAATVFAVSKHFNVPAAAILRIADHLKEGETVFDLRNINSKHLNEKTKRDMFEAALTELISY